MKKILWLAIWLGLLANVSKAEISLRQSTATEVIIKFYDATDGVTPETALTVTNFDCNIFKHADASIAATALTITASGGSNDSSHLADGAYRLELSAANTDTVGRLFLSCHSNAGAPFDGTPFEAWFVVKPQRAWEATVTIGPATVDDMLETDCSTIASNTSPFGLVCDNVDSPISAQSVVKRRTTIATLATQTSFTLSDGSTSNDAYKGWLILVQDDSATETYAKAIVSAYTGATKTVTLQADPAIFTMAVGDFVYLIPEAAVTPTAYNRTLDIAATGEAGLDFGNTVGTLDAAEIGSDAITAAKISTDFGQELSDEIWNEDVESTHQTAGSAGKKLDDAGTSADPWSAALPGAYTAGQAGNILGNRLDAAVSSVAAGSTAVHSGTAQAGTSTTITLAAGASAIDNFYRGKLIRLTGGTGAGQSAFIIDYVGSTKVATVKVVGGSGEPRVLDGKLQTDFFQDQWFTNPSGTTTYSIEAFTGR